MKKTGHWSVYSLIFICVSLNCCSNTSLGHPIRASLPLALIGNATISRIFSSSFNNGLLKRS